jgi:hypothetical protein
VKVNVSISPNTELCSANDFLHWRVVVQLENRYSCGGNREWWVSILIDNGVYAVDQKTSCLTVLLCSAWARCCALSSPILFDQRLQIRAVYAPYFTVIQAGVLRPFVMRIRHKYGVVYGAVLRPVFVPYLIVNGRIRRSYD